MSKRYFMHRKRVINNLILYIVIVAMILIIQLISNLHNLIYITLFLILLLTLIDISYARYGLYDRVSFGMRGITVYRIMHRKLFRWDRVVRLEVSDFKKIVWVFVVIDQGNGKIPFEFYMKDNGKILKELRKYRYFNGVDKCKTQKCMIERTS